MSGVAAVDLYENKLQDLPQALDVLIALFRSGLSTLPVRERLARAAAKAEAWPEAIEVLQQLMKERETAEARAGAARLAMAIHRDRLGQPGQALEAVKQLLSDAPDDAEAVGMVLDGVFDAAASRELLLGAQPKLVEQLVEDPFDVDRVKQLAQVAFALRNAPVRQAALGALVALGQGSPDIDRELSQLDQRVAHVPQIAINEASLPDLADPEDRGPLSELMSTMAPTFAETLGPGLGAFGVGKRDRIDPREGLPVRNEMAAWAGALGIGDFDLYVGGRDPVGVYAVATERPALVIGSSVSAPFPPAQRQQIARELFALRRGTTILRHRDSTEVAALIVATCRIADVDIESPAYAMLAEFERQLKATPRRIRKMLPDIAERVARSRKDSVAWIRAATSSLDRMAAIAAGDVSWVLASVAQKRGVLGASSEAQQRARRLLAFVLSAAYIKLREQLGMGVR
jgi:tetratricopeptide (TPR) repeat protein